MCKPKIHCWCGAYTSRPHYPFDDPENGPAHNPSPPCPDCGQEPHPGECFPTCSCHAPSIQFCSGIWLCTSCGLEADDTEVANFMAVDYLDACPL